jgi:hypothetical protein
MKKNMGSADRIIRIGVAAVFATLFFTGIVTGIWGTVLLVLAIILLLTSLVGFCALYALLVLNTCPNKKIT